MVKSKLCLDNEKMGDSGRAHRCFNKKTFFIGFYIFMHRLPAPSVPELGVSYYSPMLQVWASHFGLMFVLNVLNSPRTFIKINYMYEVKGLLHRIGTRQNRWQ